MQIKELNIYDKKYPIQLKQIYNPPKKLYYIGNIDLLNSKTIGVIGARNNTKYGERVAIQISKMLVDNNVTVVSGLAKGIDSYAHIGGIEKTIAVLGSGFYNIYPKENICIAKKIIQNNGLIITEYASNQKAEPQNFPMRNRIIIGVSNALIVVEAKMRSGTMITVDLALEQGKDVYAVPGNIYSEQSKGTNELINQGAKILTDFNDIEI